MAMLEVKNLNVYYGGFQALSDITLSVERDQIVSILGSNGAGKSTLLKTISGLLKPSSGSIHFNGEKIDPLGPHDIVKLGLALVPEGRKIFSTLTVLENLLIGSYSPGARRTKDEQLENVFELFPRLGERKGQLGSTLSGGEQQMLAIGRALMSQPRLIIFDEISLGLSPVIVKHLYHAVNRIKQKGMVVVLVEQDVKRSLKTADSAYILQEGKIRLKGNPKDFTEEEVKKAYFGL
ncbi:MAG: ABC transporter ATP-binding protein [Thermodesulfobacteriota bacterium]